MEEQFEIEDFSYESRSFSMEVSYEWEVSNDGIGPYEYWGAKCNDKGRDYAEVDNWAIDNLVEYLEDGTEVDILESNPLFKQIHDAIEGEVLNHADSIEIDTSEPHEE